MDFAGMNYLAVVVAAAASFIFGSVYYMTLAKAWLAAQGRTKEEFEAASGKSPLPFIIAAVAQLVMAFMLAGVIGHLGVGQVTPINGIVTALFVWVGFVLTTMAVNYGFQGRRPALAAIDGGHWLGVLVMQGLVIGLFGV